MNSIEDLNNKATSPVEFVDFRPTNINFLVGTPLNNSVTIDENQTHVLSTGGLIITDIINYESCLPKLTINLNPISEFSVGLTLSNPSANIVLSQPGTNIFVITGINGPVDWASLINGIVIQIPFDLSGTFVYSPTLTWTTADGPQTKTWTTTLTVNAVTYLTTPSDFTFTANKQTVFPTTLRIIDNTESFDPIWTLVIAPSSVDNINTIGSTYIGGGSFTFNNTSKVVTLVGNTADVNQHLDNLTVTYGASELDFTVQYNLSNNLSIETDLKSNSVTSLTSNVFRDRIYLSNQSNFPFSTFVPVFNNLSALSSTFVFVLSTTDGELSYPTDPADTETYTTPASSITISSTYTNLISIIQLIKFYPVKDFVDNTIYTISLYLNSVSSENLLTSGSVACNFAGAGAVAPHLYGITRMNELPGSVFPGAQSWTPTYEEIRYCQMDYLIVGAAGLNGNGDYAGGGGGGEVKLFTAQPILDQTYPIRAGISGYNYTTTFNGENARAGANGANGYSTGGNGGANGDPTKTGGSSLTATVSGNYNSTPQSVSASGGGGGAGASGGDAYIIGEAGGAQVLKAGAGGIGLTQEITGRALEYGAGYAGLTPNNDYTLTGENRTSVSTLIASGYPDGPNGTNQVSGIAYTGARFPTGYIWQQAAPANEYTAGVIIKTYV